MTLHPRPHSRSHGWSTVELAASVAILVTGMLSLAAGFHGSARLSEKTRENYLFKQTVSSKVAQLQSSTLKDIPSNCGSGSGNENFYCGDDNTDSRLEQKLYATSPRKVLLTGSMAICTETMPTTWTGIQGGLDLDLDGVVDSVLGLVGGVLGGLLGGSGGSGSSGSGSGSDYRLVPVRLSLNVNSTEGPRTLHAGVLLWR